MFDPTLRRLRRNSQRDQRKALSLEPLEDRRLLHASTLELALSAFHGPDLTGKDGPMSRLGFDLSRMYYDFLAFTDHHPGVAYETPQSLSAYLTQGELVSVNFVSLDNTEQLKSALYGLGAQSMVTAGRQVEGLVPISVLPAIASLSSLGFAQPTVKPISRGGLTTNQADQATFSDQARDLFGVDGSGITVGVLSDSFNALNYPGGIDGVARDIETGDLPQDTQILLDYLQPSASDEGRAMGQIIHDVAPGASIQFASAFFGAVSFANSIRALANAGSDIIVDDIGYATQPFFQDGVIAQAVDDVYADGVPYFSAAGNSGDTAYESAFVPSAQSIPLGGTLHDFDPGPGDAPSQRLSVPVGSLVRISFQWNQSWASLGGSGATSDLDLVLYNTAQSEVAFSRDANIGADALEFLVFFNDGTIDANNDGQADTEFLLTIQLMSGPAPTMMKYIDFGGGFTIETFPTFSGTSFGHSVAAGAMGVAAAAFYFTPEFGFVDEPVLNDFSSKGGATIYFDATGNPLPSPVVRMNPLITGVDGGNTTFFGSDIIDTLEPDDFPNFYGTSAAAPHVAAIAALMMEAAGGPGSVSPAFIYQILTETATDIVSRGDPGQLPGATVPIPNGVGFDAYSGYGLVNSLLAMQAVSSGIRIGDDVALLEGDSGITQYVFAVSYQGAAIETVTVAYTTVNVTATSGSDYQAVSGSLTFTLDGPSVQLITVSVLGDQQVEPNESFLVRLSDPVNGFLLRSEATGTILNDDVDLSVSDVTVAEGNSGSRNAVFTVLAFGEANRPISFSYSTLNGTAQSGSDYLPQAGVIALPSGNTSVQITVPVLGDRIDEDNETFLLALTGAQGARVADGIGQATIIDEDPLPSLYVSDAQVTTTAAGTYQVTFSIALDTASGRQVNVNYSTADFSAVAGVDYIAKNGVVSFAPGETNKLVAVDVMTSGIPGANKRFSLNATGVANASLSDPRGDCYIVYAAEPQNEFIIDNGAAGYSRSFNGWTTLTNTLAYQLDYDYASAGNGSAFANWNFTAIPNGTYQIFTRWSNFTNRATNAPFAIYSGLGGNSQLGTALVNQQLAPTGDFSNGVSWQSIGTFEVSSNTLRVRLANNANGIVVADAIRIVGGGIGFQSGEIDVNGFGRSITAGDVSPAPEDATDFGTVPSLGVTIERTFTITNNGNADLVLTGNPFVAIGGPNTADFTVTQMPAPVIAPGGKSDFKIAFRATEAGFRSATVSIGNTDDSEQPFEFVVQGYLAPAAAALAHNGSLPQDVNDDGRVNTSDALMIINHLLAGPAAAPLVAGLAAQPLAAPSVFYDVVPDGRVNTSDLLSIFNRLLLQTAAPQAASALAAQPVAAATEDASLVLFDVDDEDYALASFAAPVTSTPAAKSPAQSRPETAAHLMEAAETDAELAADEESVFELDLSFLDA